MALGSIGVFNNFLISFIDRRRSFALLRSIGMSRTQNTLMLVLESLSIGFIGTLSGLGVGGVLLTTIPILLEAFNVWVLLQFSSILALLMLAAGVAICLLGSVGPTIRTRKLNLIEALKYE
jgi:putative ABC transport system permease protein